MQVGDGSTAFANGIGVPISILEISTNRTAAGTSVVNTYGLPSSGGGAVTSTGLDTSYGASHSEGQISISGNYRYATFSGYGVAAGQGTMTNAAAARVIVRMDLQNGSFDTSTRIPTTEAYYHSSPAAGAGSNIRGVWTMDGSSYYVNGISSTSGGMASGTRYIAHGATSGSVRIQGSALFTNNIEYANGELYYSRVSTDGSAIYVVQIPRDGQGNWPTTAGSMGSAINIISVSGTTLPPIWGFKYSSDGQTLFTADDLGLNVWSLVGSSFTKLAGAGQSIAGSGFAQFEIDEDLLYTNIYYTNDSGLYYTTWDGSVFSNPELLLAAGSGYAFRGVAMVPEPATYALLFGLGMLLVVFVRRLRRN